MSRDLNFAYCLVKPVADQRSCVSSRRSALTWHHSGGWTWHLFTMLALVNKGQRSNGNNLPFSPKFAGERTPDIGWLLDIWFRTWAKNRCCICVVCWMRAYVAAVLSASLRTRNHCSI